MPSFMEAPLTSAWQKTIRTSGQRAPRHRVNNEGNWKLVTGGENAAEELVVPAVGDPQRAHEHHRLGDHQDLVGTKRVPQRLQGVDLPSQGHLVVVPYDHLRHHLSNDNITRTWNHDDRLSPPAQLVQHSVQQIHAQRPSHVPEVPEEDDASLSAHGGLVNAAKDVLAD